MEDPRERAQKEKHVPLLDLLGPEWATDAPFVLIATFRVFGLPDRELPAPRSFDLKAGRGVIFRGRPPKRVAFQNSVVWDGKEEHATLLVSASDAEFPPGTYCLIFLPISGSTFHAQEEALRNLIEKTGLLVALHQRGLVFERAAVDIYDTATQKPAAFHFRAPAVEWIPPAQADENRLKAIFAVDDRIACLPAEDRRRVLLSLRWLGSSLDIADHVDGFLRRWFALETLTMAGDSNIAPLVNLLSRAYQVDATHVRTTMCVGRIAGLRSDIVHGVDLPDIPDGLLRYIELLYTDALLQILMVNAQNFAKIMCADPEFALVRNFLSKSGAK